VPENGDSQPGRSRYLKGIGGVVGTVATIVGTLLALGVLHPLGGDGVVSVAEAATKTIDKGTSRVVLSMTGPLPSGSQGVLFKGDGKLDYRLNRGEVTYDYSGLAQSSPGSVPTTLSAILDDNLLYVRLPREVNGKQWVVIDLIESYKQQVGVDVGPLLAYNSNPADALKNLESAGDLEKIGKERLLDGSEATHYRGTIDLHKIAENAPADQREGLERAVNAMIAQGAPSQIPVEVWVGDDDLVRRMEMDVSVGSSKMAMRIELFDFGVTVNATPPPSELVATQQELQGTGS
jgi:hypothetical protein